VDHSGDVVGGRKLGSTAVCNRAGTIVVNDGFPVGVNLIYAQRTANDLTNASVAYAEITETGSNVSIGARVRTLRALNGPSGLVPPPVWYLLPR
jgi:hypothetical protein